MEVRKRTEQNSSHDPEENVEHHLNPAGDMDSSQLENDNREVGTETNQPRIPLNRCRNMQVTHIDHQQSPWICAAAPCLQNVDETRHKLCGVFLRRGLGDLCASRSKELDTTRHTVRSAAEGTDKTYKIA